MSNSSMIGSVVPGIWCMNPRVDLDTRGTDRHTLDMINPDNQR
jgi:hypothetical protein